MADMDEIWLEMQREQKTRNFGKTKVSDLSLLQKEKTKKAVAKRMDSSLNWMSGWSAKLKPSDQDIQRLKVADGQNPETIAVVEPPTTMVDALEELPTGTPEIFLAYIQRDINCLSEESLSVRLKSLQKLERVLVQQVDSLATDIIDAVMDALLKPLLKRMKDRSEKCREAAVKILRSLVENTSDLAMALPYIFPSLVARLGSEDLDGVAHLPEIMRPDPEQKPTEIAQPVEDSEEVRLQLGHFVASLLSRCSPTQIYSYIDEATGLIRAEAMDPFHEVKALACETMISFCYNHTEMLLHFALPLARSLTSSLTHNHAKIRIAALRAITACLWCGIWKHNFEIFEVLMAWQDPNKVPIKAFYEGVTNVNYMSTLSFDRHPAVRRFWFETLSHWMLRCVDKVDLEPYIAPYLLTGLCDENEEIALEVFWLIEKIGEAYETEHEEDLRKTKQYGFDYTWTYGGRASVPFPLQGIWAGGKVEHVRKTGARGPDFLGQKALPDHHHRELLDDGEEDEDDRLGTPLEMPRRDYCWPDIRSLEVFPRLPRPRLGSRSWVRTHSRRYIKATFNDVVDFRDCTALNAGRLLCMSVAYTEEGVTEWLQPMLAALTKFYSGRAWAAGDTRAMQTYGAVCKLLGAFLEPSALWGQLKAALDADSAMELDQRVASMRILAMCLEGHVEVLQSIQPPDPTLGMGQLEPVIPELIEAMHNSDLLLSPTPESREVMWSVLFSFLEPLRPFLTEIQVSQLLFVCLALASKAPEPDQERRKKGLPQEPSLPEVEEDDPSTDPSMCRAVALLSGGAQESLDSLDDDMSTDASVQQQRLFQRAFGQIMERTEESFQVFRSVLQLTPTSVLLQEEHQPLVLQRLATFGGALAAAETRCATQVLGVQLALRSANQDFIWQVFQILGAAQMSGSVQSLSFSVAISGLAHWRSFFLTRLEGTMATATWALKGKETSQVLQWITSTFADQELYKKYYSAMEHAEKVLTGADQDDWVLEKARYIRVESERRANVVRCAAGSCVLLALRTGHLWAEGEGRCLFQSFSSVFATAPHTMEPPFVKPTPPELVLYAAEVLHVLLHLDAEHEEPVAQKPFRLLDDAARAIHGLTPSTPRLPQGLRLSRDEEEQLVSDFIGAMLQLNLSLPPDPKAKFAPASLDESAKDVMLGWDIALEGGAVPSQSGRTVSTKNAEVARVLAQSSECLRWNAALALYVLGMDLAQLFKDAFEGCMSRWKKRKEQAKVLLAQDVLQRGGVAK